MAAERNIERNDLIRETALRNPKWTMGMVAAHLKLSRGVVVGVLDRMRGSVAMARRPVAGAQPGATTAPQKPSAPPVATPDSHHPAVMLRVNLLSLKTRHCRAPLNHGANGLMTFCGLDKVPRSSYCDHHRLRYGGGSPA